MPFGCTTAPCGDRWFVDEVFVRIDGKQPHLYRAVDQDGQVLDILVQTRRNSMQTTGPRSHMSRLGSENVGCDDSSLCATPNCSYPFTAQCRTFSPFLVICCERNTIERSGPTRSIYMHW